MANVTSLFAAFSPTSFRTPSSEPSVLETSPAISASFWRSSFASESPFAVSSLIMLVFISPTLALTASSSFLSRSMSASFGMPLSIVTSAFFGSSWLSIF